MQSLVERAAAVLRRQTVPRLPLRELLRLLRDSGVVVSEPVLIRALSGAPDRFRLVEPWRALARRRGSRRAPPFTGRVREGPAGGRAEERNGELPWEEDLWVLPSLAREPADAPSGERVALGRMRSSLVGLGWSVDATSSRDLSRWVALVREAESFRSRLSPDVRAADA